MNAPQYCVILTLPVLFPVCSIKYYVPLNLVATHLLISLLFCCHVILLFHRSSLKTVEELLLPALKSNFIPHKLFTCITKDIAGLQQ